MTLYLDTCNTYLYPLLSFVLVFVQYYRSVGTRIYTLRRSSVNKMSETYFVHTARTDPGRSISG